MIILLFIICTIFTVLFFKEWRSHPGFTFFGVGAFYIICILWVPYYVICNYILDTEWKYPISNLDFFYVTVTFVSSILISIFLKKAFRLRPVLHRLQLLSDLANSLKGRVYMVVGGIIATGCIVGLAATKGITLSVGNYGSRFESNTDTGAFTILSYVIVSIAVLRLFRKPGLRSMIFSLIATIVYGVILFLTLGGERNYLIAAVMPILLIAYAMKIVREKQLAMYLLGGVAVITFLAMVRYGNDFGNGALELIVTYTRDTVFPVDSLSEIFDNRRIHFVGFDYFFNQAYAIVPRALWPGKPIYLDTVAYFFTEQIYGYGKGLIIAPTGIGSLYLMGGWLFIFIGAPMLVSVFLCFDYLIFNGRSIFFICLWPTIFFSFFCFRESVELGLYKIIVHAMGTWLVYIISVVVYSLLPKIGKRRSMRTRVI